MLQAHQVEELICLVSALDRESLTRQFLNFRGSFPVDVTPEFIEGLSLERLRHIFVALCLQAQQVPVGGAVGPVLPAA
jgi:hypothetical protein